ncbi:MAG: response regulator [Microcoleaceae cyanobacterium]
MIPLLRFLSSMLLEQGYEVRKAVNGQMALRSAQAEPPDLILLDIRMPDMSGYEVCQRLNSLGVNSLIPNPASDFNALIDGADQALREAIIQGGDRIACVDSDSYPPRTNETAP